MGAPKQLTKLKQQFESPAYEGVSRAETGNKKGDIYHTAGALKIVIG